MKRREYRLGDSIFGGHQLIYQGLFFPQLPLSFRACIVATCCYRYICHGLSALGIAHFGISSQVAYDYYGVIHGDTPFDWVSVYVLIPDDRRPVKVAISLTKYLQNNCTLNCCLWEDILRKSPPIGHLEQDYCLFLYSTN